MNRSFEAPYAPEERITSLKELTELEQRRIEMEASLREVHIRIDALQNSLFQTERRPLRARLRDISRMDGIVPRRRMARGELRSEILSRLKRAGTDGVRVHDLADALGMRAVNIHSWFHSAIKRFPEIKKTGPSHYQLTGQLEFPDLSEGLYGTGAVSIREQGYEVRRRGEVTQNILRVLGEAGQTGLSVREIAKLTASSYRRVHVWLSSTGKRNGLVSRLARGTYGLAAGTPDQPEPAGIK